MEFKFLFGTAGWKSCTGLWCYYRVLNNNWFFLCLRYSEPLFLLFFFLKIIYFRERMVRRGRRRGREKPKQTLHRAQRPVWGLISWPWDLHLTWNQQSNAQATVSPRCPYLWNDCMGIGWRARTIMMVQVRSLGTRSGDVWRIQMPFSVCELPLSHWFQRSLDHCRDTKMN